MQSQGIDDECCYYVRMILWRWKLNFSIPLVYLPSFCIVRDHFIVNIIFIIHEYLPTAALFSVDLILAPPDLHS